MSMNERNAKWMSRAGIFLILFLSIGFWTGASAAVLSEKDMRHIVSAYIEKNMPWNPGALRIEYPMRLQEQQFQEKKITWQVQGRQDDDFIGETIFNIRFYNQEGILIREIPVHTKLEAALDVVVSTKPLSRGTVLEPDDIRLCQRWYNRYPQDVVTDPDDAIGKMLSTQVRSNTEITKSVLKASRLIRKGSIVKMVAESGSLVVTAMGLSQENGGKGDIIRVKNLSSNKVIYAKVIDPSLVKVDF